jgi:hypothetical protein
VKSKIAFLTTIFPMDKKYLYDYFGSLDNQSNKEFDIIVVNDGYENFEEVKCNFSKLNIIELKFSSSISKNRECGIHYILDNHYDVVVFGDSDDYFSSNRVEKCIELLNKYEIVVNDFSLFNENGVYSEKYISNRLVNRNRITIDMIKKKNFFGLSNTAVKAKLLQDTSFDDGLVAVDWYLYSKLLLDNRSSVFTNETLTYYRQYSQNTVGIGDVTKDAIKRGLEVKLMHYKLLSNSDESYNNLYSEIKKLKSQLVTEDDFDQYLSELKRSEIEFPLWWEEVSLQRNSNEIN